jgi:hypothetical protein
MSATKTFEINGVVFHFVPTSPERLTMFVTDKKGPDRQGTIPVIMTNEQCNTLGTAMKLLSAREETA